MNTSRVKRIREKHGHTIGGAPTPTYQTWAAMIKRCTNENDKNYHRYGGRGISVCERWMSYINFLEDMGERCKGLTIDRIDNNKGYSPENCRWATWVEQAQNKEVKKYEANGRIMTMREWSEFLGIGIKTLHRRIEKNWTYEEVFSPGLHLEKRNRNRFHTN